MWRNLKLFARSQLIGTLFHASYIINALDTVPFKNTPGQLLKQNVA